MTKRKTKGWYKKQTQRRRRNRLRNRKQKSIMKKSDCRQFMTAKWVRFFWQADREQDLVWISQKEC